MKRVILFILLAVVLTSGLTLAVEPTTQKYAFELDSNPLAWLLGIFSGGMEIKLNNSMTICPGFDYLNFWWLTAIEPSASITAFEGHMFLNYFVKKTAMRGFYLGPKLSLGFAHIIVSGTETGGLIGDVGGNLGYQWIFKNGFLFDMYAGYSIGFASANVSSSSDQSLSGGTFYGLRMGWAF